MSCFADNLRELPSIELIAQLEIRDGTDRLVDVIENRPGCAGSVAVYHAVTQTDGRLDRAAAERALRLYAEHVADARAQPGKHPNIDRLFKEPLINLIKRADARHRRVKKRSLHRVNEYFEPGCNAADAASAN